jgi:hypothetical protein
MKKLAYDQELAFEVEKELMRLHPRATRVRVNPCKNGLVAEVEEDGKLIDVGCEMVAYIDKKLWIAKWWPTSTKSC